MKDARTAPTEEVTLNEKKIEERLTGLLRSRKGQINHLQTCLNLSNKTAHFMKTINLVQKHDAINDSFHQKPNKMLVLKAHYILGSFLSSTLDLPNCNEKLQVVYKILSDFELFLEQLPSMEEKFLISSLPQLALAPPSVKLKIDIVDFIPEKKEATTTGNKLQNATSKFFNFIEKSLTIAHKKAIKVNEKRYTMQDKRIFLDYFKHSFKVSQLPEKINVFLVVSTLSEILDILLTAFMDEVYFTRESFELLRKIDELIQSNFLKIIYQDLYRFSSEEAGKELETFLDKTNSKESDSLPSLERLAQRFMHP